MVKVGNLVTCLTILFTSIVFSNEKKVDFNTLFGDYAKAYYEFYYAKPSKEANEKMWKAVESAVDLSQAGITIR